MVAREEGEGEGQEGQGPLSLSSSRSVSSVKFTKIKEVHFENYMKTYRKLKMNLARNIETINDF